MRPDLVRKARQHYMREFSKHGVYTKVPEAECWQVTGKAPIGTRWVDVNKSYKTNPHYRSCLVAKEINTDKREDLVAATPQLEALKLLISFAVTDGIGIKRG